MIYDNRIYKNICKPLPTYGMTFFYNVLFWYTTELFKIFMLFPKLFYFIYKLLFNFKNSTDYLSPFQFNWTFIDSFFLILNAEFCINFVLFLENESFVVTSKFSITINESGNLRRWEITFKMRPIGEYYVHRPKISTNSSVQSNISKGNEIPIKSEFIAFHIVRRNRRTMTCLFIINWNSPNVSLECLTKNGVERFLHYKFTTYNVEDESCDIF